MTRDGRATDARSKMHGARRIYVDELLVIFSNRFPMPWNMNEGIRTMSAHCVRNKVKIEKGEQTGFSFDAIVKRELTSTKDGRIDLWLVRSPRIAPLDFPREQR